MYNYFTGRISYIPSFPPGIATLTADLAPIMNLSTPPLTRSQVANGESAKKVEVITVKEVDADVDADAEGEDEDEITQEEDEEADAQDDDLDDDDEVDKSVSMRPSRP